MRYVADSASQSQILELTSATVRSILTATNQVQLGTSKVATWGSSPTMGCFLRGVVLNRISTRLQSRNRYVTDALREKKIIQK